MENCLVTKLKGVVDNFNLPLMNEIRFRVYKQSDEARPTIVLAINPGTVVKTDGHHYLYVDGSATGVTSFETTKTTGNKQYTIQCDNEAYDFIIEDRNKLLGIIKPYTITGRNIGYNPEVLQYCPNTIELSWNQNSYIKGVFIPNSSANYYYISFENCINVEINVDKLSNLVSNNINSVIFAGTNAYGSISSLVNISKTSLSKLYLNDTNINGELNTFLNSVASERTSGTLAILYGNTRITKDGSAGSEITIRFGSSMVNPTAEDTARGWQVVQ